MTFDQDPLAVGIYLQRDFWQAFELPFLYFQQKCAQLFLCRLLG